MNNLLINFNDYRAAPLLVLAKKILPLIFRNNHFDSKESWTDREKGIKEKIQPLLFCGKEFNYELLK